MVNRTARGRRAGRYAAGRRRTLTTKRWMALPEKVRQRLQGLGLHRGGELADRPAPALSPVPGIALESHPVETAGGTCLVAKAIYPGSYVHGAFPLEALLQEPLDDWAALATTTGVLASDSAAGLAFFDIETTGLSDGAGTYAFLVGLGRFEGGEFCLYQIFLRSPAEERPFLLALDGLLEDATGLVSFNGHRFDLPVLRARYTMARMGLPWEGKAHLDLLLPARRLWRDRLSRCNLATLEGKLLGVERDARDIPGWRIPSLYHDYLRGADPSTLLPVFYHNAQDILSLVTLAVRMGRLLRDPWGDGGARHGLEFYALGRLYQQRGNLPAAVAAYRAALLLALPVEIRERVWKRLSILLKRQGQWTQAIEIWQALIGRPGEHPLYAYVELAKYYEHRCRDLDRAVAVVRQAIAEYGETPPEDDLAHRLRRLQRKQRKQKEKP